MPSYTDAAVLLVSGNILYLIGLLVFVTMGNWLPPSLLSGGPFSFYSVIQAYLLLGGILAIADLASVISVIGGLNSGF